LVIHTIVFFFIIIFVYLFIFFIYNHVAPQYIHEHFNELAFLYNLDEAPVTLHWRALLGLPVLRKIF